jgi:imidazolonepropionase-like amidohydrolase
LEAKAQKSLIDGAGDNPIRTYVSRRGEIIAYSVPVGGYETHGEMEVFDAADGTILPVFIDCHTHMVAGMTAL